MVPTTPGCPPRYIRIFKRQWACGPIPGLRQFLASFCLGVPPHSCLASFLSIYRKDALPLYLHLTCQYHTVNHHKIINIEKGIYALVFGIRRNHTSFVIKVLGDLHQ